MTVWSRSPGRAFSRQRERKGRSLWVEKEGTYMKPVFGGRKDFLVMSHLKRWSCRSREIWEEVRKEEKREEMGWKKIGLSRERKGKERT
jgi:hypothetical protein